MGNKIDCIVVLGFGFKNKDKLPSILLSRLNTAIDLYKNNPNSKLIMVGGLSNKELGVTEAKVMREYAIRRGVNSKDVLKEETSADTIGNVFFLKRQLLRPKNWKTLIVVTSDFHIPRTKIIFNKVLGKNYRIKFVGTKTFHIPTMIYNRLGFEKEFIKITKEFFRGIKNGNDKKIKKLLDRMHPLYSERGLKELSKLSDEELAKRFRISLETTKRIRKYVERRLKLAGK